MNKKISLFFVSFFLFFLLLSGETIERIIIEGNKRVSRDTVLFYMRSKEGGTYSAAILRKDFKSLWDTGFFENINV